MRRKIQVRRYVRTNGTPVRKHERNIRLRQRVDFFPQTGYEKILMDAKKDNSLWAQPIRAQPDKDIIKQKNKRLYIVKLATNEIKQWGAEDVYLDSKVRGVRAIIVYDYNNDEIKILSRAGNRLTDLEDKYSQTIQQELGTLSGDAILESEFYVTKNGKGLHQADINGFVHNPTDKKYKSSKGTFQIFDILMLNGRDTRNQSLTDRKEILNAYVDNKGILKRTPTKKLHLSSDWNKNQKNIHKQFNKSLTLGHEGLVVKDADSVYQHRKGKGLHWLKLKDYETVDLSLKSVSSYPRVATGKQFRFYKHWNMGVRNSSHTVKVDKGIRNAGFDNDFYMQFTKNQLEKVDKGEVKASKKMISVDPKYRSYYGRDTVPESIEIPKKDQQIVELFMEDISKEYRASGVKIIGFRPDKTKPDSMNDIKRVYQTFYG